MRRSQVSKPTLPLDLHVLGLPLAFILSQDQTLHCKIFLHSCEHELMSSANLARINEFNFNVTICLLTQAYLPFVFSSHSKNVCCFQLRQHGGLYYKPFSLFAAPYFSWECKDTRTFLLCKPQSEKLFNVFVCCWRRLLPIEA